MGLLDYWKKPQLPEGVTQTPLACTRDTLTIRGTEYRPDQRGCEGAKLTELGHLQCL